MLIVMFVFYTIVNIKLYWYCANYIREWRDPDCLEYHFGV
jgi:hypothetical protein